MAHSWMMNPMGDPSAGRTDLPTSVIWLFPPSLADYASSAGDFDTEGLAEAYRTADNAIMLCNALIQPLMQNTLSIDTEDNHRIVTFVDFPTRVPTAPSVPSHLPHHPPMSAVAFWYLHFKWTLRTHFVGGDVTSEEHDPDPSVLMDELIDDRANLQDPKWNTGIGAEVLADFFEQTLCLKRVDSDEDHDDDSEGGVDGTGDPFYSDIRR
ncbi:hypothetical protein MSAN_02430300 [Mycena sanguinolenta]|uniref:Uncharacterized protein n=1 Tax=Mycena sanguinolenta TaxID=230812 RepID=A0A8H6X383_9AGAR|nr:hypothetical protein MSAN_02430300 [Mycena sanguinolenta]